MAKDRPPPKKPVMLLIHGGGFSSGSPADMKPAAERARKQGFRPVKVEYTLGNLAQATKDVKKVAKTYKRKGRDVYAFGNSAGGSLAAMLTRRKLAKASVANSAPVDLPKWFSEHPTAHALAGSPSQRAMRKASPALHRNKGKVLNLGSDDDPVVDPTPAQEWAEQSPGVSYRPVEGGHQWSNPAVYRIGMRYLAKRARKDSRR